MSHHRPTIASSLFLALAALPAAAQNQNWIRQLGTSSDDFVYGAASDGTGGIYVGGETEGSLAAPHAGAEDAWVARYDAAGSQLWIRQIGTSSVDYTMSAAADGGGGVFLCGRSYGSLGGSNAGAVDPWVARYDSAGNQLWIRQFGTSSYDYGGAAAPDGSGGVYVSGQTSGNLGGASAGGFDAWFARFDGSGNQLWIRQLGTSGEDRAYVLANDGSSGVYVGGPTNGNLGGPNAGNYDAWLARYDSAGNPLWIRQIGTSADDHANAAAPDGSGGAYISGYTSGSLGGPNAGSYDAWLARYDSAGNQLWIRQLGTSADDRVWEVGGAASDGSGIVCITGYTNGSLGGPNAGSYDAWVARYDSAGSQVSIVQFGTSSDDRSHAAVIEGSGGVYIGGRTNGSLGGPSAGGLDAWLALYDAACPSPTTYCLGAINTTGHGAAIGWYGSTSIAASAFTLTAIGCPAQKSGLFFFGVHPTQIPFGEGYLCVTGGQQRFSPLKTDTGGIASYTLDFTDPTSPASLITAGSQWNFQLWYRDPQPVGHGFNFTDALHAEFCP